MIGPAAGWMRPADGRVPPWLTAIATVGAIMLMINALPMLASAITPDRVAFVPTAGPPDPIPLGAPVPTPAVSVKGQSPAGTATTQTPRKPLPVSGSTALPTVALGGVLLAGGLGLLMMVGFTGAGPWPGRYVRRNG